MILWEISDATTTAASQYARSVTATTTAVTARMRGVAVSSQAIVFVLLVLVFHLLLFYSTSNHPPSLL